MQSNIKVSQVVSLLILELSIIISWIAYHEYQPILVDKFQLKEFAFLLIIAQGVILTLTPIVSGYIADKMRNKNGATIPIVNFGISATAMIFMSVAITVFSEPQGLLRFILPFLIVLWLISMNIFRSPAISLIEYFVPQKDIPKIYAYFVVLGNIGYALEPLIVDLVQFFGGVLTFVVGGVLVFGTGTLLSKKSKLITPEDITAEFNNDTTDGKSNYFLVFAAAIVFGLMTSVIFKILPNHIISNNIQFFDLPNFGKILSTSIVVLSAIITFGISRFITNEKIQILLIIGSIIGLTSIGLIFNINSQFMIILLSIIISIGYAAVSLAALPYALFKLGTKNTILGLGIFFGTMEFIDSIFEILQII